MVSRLHFCNLSLAIRGFDAYAPKARKIEKNCNSNKWNEKKKWKEEEKNKKGRKSLSKTRTWIQDH